MTEAATTRVGADTMSGSDALLWTIGADPVMRPTIVAVLVLGGPPDWDEVRSRVARLTELVPRLRSRAVPRPPGLGRPQFLADQAFDLAAHLRRMRLPEHGRLRDVLDLAQTMATTAFDPALPLWEAVVVEEVEGSRAAVVLKVHHALIDGVGGLSVLAHLFDGLEGADEATAAAARAPGRATSRCGLDFTGALRIVGDGADALVHPFRSFGRLAALGGSVARLMAPSGRPLSPIMRGRSFRRHAEILDLDLSLLHEGAHHWHGTVNDVFVVAVVRGLARYHEQRGAPAAGFRALMPVNVRAAGDAESGNHFVPARFVIPVHSDLADTVAEVRRTAGAWKHAPGLAVSDVLAAALSALPSVAARSLWSSMLLGTDFCITNIPGPAFRASLDGKPVEGIFALSPPSGAAFNISLVSCADRASVTITADVAAVPDCAKLASCIDDGFAEVCSVVTGPP